MTDELVDARGVVIEPGDAVIYGFGVDRSVAMAEGVVLPEHEDHTACMPPCLDGVSLTASGRVRIRVVRRSYGGGEKPVVSIAPDRMVVLKEVDGPLQPGAPEPCFALPTSPLPTQDEENAATIRERRKRHTARLRALGNGEPLTNHERSYAARYHADESPLGYWVLNYTRDLAKDRAALKEIEDRDD